VTTQLQLIIIITTADEMRVDIEPSYRWLKSGNIRGETESTIVAAEDQGISTNYFKNKILKEEIESKCRICKQDDETIDQLKTWPQDAPFWRRTNI